MELNDYALNAYRRTQKNDGKDSVTSKSSGSERPESISAQIRRNKDGGHESLVHKPVFKKINSQINQLLESKKKDKEAFIQSQNAAKSGSYFLKRTSQDNLDVKEAARNLTSGGLVKVSQENHKDSANDSIYRRVAKFLVIIGVDEAAKIIHHLTEEQTEKIIPEIASIRSVSPEEAQAVLQEFQGLMQKAREEGGVDTARTILTKAYGAQKAEELIGKSVKYAQGRPFDFLDDADPERIQLLLNGESIAVQSLVLSQLEPKKAAGVINRMDVDTKRQIVLRLAKISTVSPEVMEGISKSLHEKLLTQNTENSRNLDGRGVLAQILRKMDVSSESSIINTLSEENPELGADLRKLLFTEEDVVNCDDRFMQEKLRLMSEENISILIRGKTMAFRTKILCNVSKTRGDIILEEEAMKDHILRSESERVTSQFYAELRRAWESGELIIKGRDDDEVYV